MDLIFTLGSGAYCIQITFFSNLFFLGKSQDTK